METFLARRACSIALGLAAFVPAGLEEAAFLGARLTRKAASCLANVAADQATLAARTTRSVQATFKIKKIPLEVHLTYY